MFLSTLLVNFYQLAASNGDIIAGGQDGIAETTIATSYIEIASGLAFDTVTDTSDIALSNPNSLTAPSQLGHSFSEDSLYKFNDFDDFKEYSEEKEMLGSGRRYKTAFDVYYVDPNNINNKSSVRTFVKRLDLKVWRTFPPPDKDSGLDTLRAFTTMGYFHFD
jgi:hypothetical protein